MKKFLTIFFSVLLVLLTVFLNVYTSIAKSIKPEIISSNIDEKLFNNFIYDDNGNKTDIFKTILKLTTLDEETVIKLIKHQTVDDILTDIVNSIYDYNLTNDESYKFSKEKIISIVEDNIDKVMNDINYNLTKKDREYTINYTYENTDYIINTIYNTDIGDYEKH